MAIASSLDWRSIVESRQTADVFGRGYAIEIVSANKARVFHERLGGWRTITTLLADGEDNPKTDKVEIPVKGLSLLPANGAGTGVNNCLAATVCILPCLANQGQGPMPGVKGGRMARTALLHLVPEWFYQRLNTELFNFRHYWSGVDLIGCRLNMFSDWRWEDTPVIDQNRGIVFYDYSKLPGRYGWLRENYHVTFSYDGHNWEHCQEALDNGGTVSVVFHDDTPGSKCGKASKRQRLPESFRGYRVTDGDVTDWRPDDKPGTIVGLRLKARTYESRNYAIDKGFSTLAN